MGSVKFCLLVVLSVSGLLAACGGGGSSSSAVPVALLDVDKWQELDVERQIADGVLVSALRSSGDVAYEESNNLLMVGPVASLNSIQADVSLAALSATGTTRPRARVAGRYYDSTNGDMGRTGEVVAEISLRLSGNLNDLVAFYYIGACGDADCSTQSFLTFNYGEIENISLNQVHTMGIDYDGATTFLFHYDNLTIGPIGVGGLAPFDSAINAPFIGTKNNNMGPGDTGFVEARFDNVYLNGFLYDDFSSSEIDPTRWSFTNLELERRIKNKVFCSSIGATGDMGIEQNNSLSMVTPVSSVSSFQADVKLLALAASGSARPRARVFGAYYDSTSGDSGRTGHVIAEVDLRLSSNLVDLVAVYFVGICGDDECTTPNFNLITATEITTINLNESHTLGIDYDGATTFTFKYDNQAFGPFNVELNAPFVSAVNEPFIGTKINNMGITDHGFVLAEFDNVYLGGSLYDNFE